MIRLPCVSLSANLHPICVCLIGVAEPQFDAFDDQPAVAESEV